MPKTQNPRRLSKSLNLGDTSPSPELTSNDVPAKQITTSSVSFGISRIISGNSDEALEFGKLSGSMARNPLWAEI